MLKSIVTIVFVFFVHDFLHSQMEANHWFFGNKASINFNTTPPTSMGGSQMNAWEGVASISNSAGQLMFYTDGITVWNRNHQVMPNGTNLKGNPSSAQNGVIVPKPNHPNIYYIFSVPHEAGSVLNPARLHYSKVDMSLQGGLGDVVSTEKNVQLSNHRIQEKITAVRHCNNQDVWVLCHEHNSNKFLVYLVSNSNPAPVFSHEQAIGESWGSSSWNAIGVMKASPNGRKIAESSNDNNKTQVLDFDSYTGMLSNPIVLSNTNWSYGVEFSPDNTKLYVSIWYDNSPGGKRIYQYDLNAPNIANSRVQINTNSFVGQLQLGPDGKIYVARNTNDSGGNNNGRKYLGAITSPNSYDGTANAVGYIDEFIDLGGNESSPANGRLSRFGLPNFIQSYFQDPSDFSYTGTCQGDITQFQASIPYDYDSLVWNFNNLGISNTNPSTYTFPNSGTYDVSLIVYSQCAIDTIIKQIDIVESLNITIAPSNPTICEGDSVSLIANPTSAQINYQWDNGAEYGGITVSPSQTTTYSVVATHASGCTSTASTIVNVISSPIASFIANPTSGCQPLVVSFVNTGTSGITSLWEFGDGQTSSVQNPTHTYTNAGSYTVKLTLSTGGGCSESETKFQYISVWSQAHASFNPVSPIANLSNPTVDFVNSSTNANSYFWNFGTGTSTSSNAIVSHTYPSEAGEYQVMLIAMNENGCNDTIYRNVKIIDDELIFPNVITPDGDGVNDNFVIVNADSYPGNVLKIYNRWGKLIYEATDYKNDWNGLGAPDGTYYYIFYYADKTHHGSLTIIGSKQK